MSSLRIFLLRICRTILPIIFNPVAGSLAAVFLLFGLIIHTSHASQVTVT
jgi:hypothetical protein